MELLKYGAIASLLTTITHSIMRYAYKNDKDETTLHNISDNTFFFGLLTILLSYSHTICYLMIQR